MRIGVDASNVRSGGGLAHLINIISGLSRLDDWVTGVEVWCGADAALYLSCVESPSVTIHREPELDGAFWKTMRWRQFELPGLTKRLDVDCLLSPGGLVPLRRTVPTVVMSQNALPFEERERKRYGISEPMRWRLEYLRHTQRRSFNRADAVIALSEYTRGLLSGSGVHRAIEVVPHGVEERFFVERERPATSAGGPLTVLYVSPVERYKHHAAVVRAASSVAGSYPLTLRLVGKPADLAAVRDLQTAIRESDPDGTLVEQRGHVTDDELAESYAEADVFVFASTCENFPITLLEAMAAGLPIISSSDGAMPEALGDAGIYFNLEDIGSLEEGLSGLLADETLRRRLGEQARSRARQFAWESTVRRTAEVLSVASSGRR